MSKDFVKLRRLPGQDQVLTQLQSNIDTAFSQIQQIPPLRGALLTGVLLTSGQDNIINHGLGRAYQGFVVARLSADSRVWESSTTNVQPTTQIIIRSSANCTVNLWVY